MILICGGGDDRPTVPPGPIDRELRDFVLERQGARVLVVDDDPDIVDVLAALLIAERYDVDRSYGGKEAVERIIAEPPPDLVLLDWRMSPISGRGVLGLMGGTAGWDQVPVLIITASKYRDVETEQDENFIYLSSSLLDAKRRSKRPPPVVPKTIDPTRLLDVIRRTLDTRKAP